MAGYGHTNVNGPQGGRVGGPVQGPRHPDGQVIFVGQLICCVWQRINLLTQGPPATLKMIHGGWLNTTKGAPPFAVSSLSWSIVVTKLLTFRSPRLSFLLFFIFVVSRC